MMMIRLCRAVVALVLLAVLPSSAVATTMLQVDVPEMTALSEAVVHARVVAVDHIDLRAVPQADGTRRGLFTDVTLAVIDRLEGGDAPAEVKLRLIGGRGADGVSVLVPGMPHFAAGDEVVVFLEKTGKGYIPCGLTQGVWRVHYDRSGQAWVQQDHTHAQLVAPRRGAGLGPVAAPALSRGMPLQVLAQQVTEARARQGRAGSQPAVPAAGPTPASGTVRE